MQAVWVQGPRGVPLGPAKRVLVLHKIEIKCKPRGEFIEDIECRQSIWETHKGKKDESHLCLESVAFTEDCGLIHRSSQTSKNKDECLSVFHMSFMPWSQGLEKCS